MKYLLIPLLCILATSKIIVQSKFSKTGNTNIANNIFYNFIVFITIAILLLPYVLKNVVIHETIFFGIIMGVLNIIFQFFYICAFSKGKMSLTVIINNFSMILPMIVSFVVFDETLSIFKIAGTALALVSFVLSAQKEKNSTCSEKANKTRVQWIVFTLLVFLSNGLIAINQKIYANFTSKLQVFEFVAIAYITSAVLSFLILTVISLRNKNVFKKKQPKNIVSGCLVGILLCVFQCINTYSASIIDGIILYSTYNCGVSLLSTISAKILFKETLSSKQYAGVFIGTLSILLLCL